MSHTTFIRDIEISDIAALKLAVKDLQKTGIKCELVEDETPRAFYANQKDMGAAPYVLKLHDAKYDVGIYRTEGGKVYEARADFWGGSIEKILGVEDDSVSENQSKLGKLYQFYSLAATTRAALSKGYKVIRHKIENGIQLRITT